ncbi:peptidase C39 family protein [Candidatus Woesearchaeota archaeon]|nr:peptidase C39 family protein [Candidatus Woesearchaeota archaeon]
MQNYKQTTKFTGLASAIMLIINHFNQNFKVNRENEFKIWREIVLLPTRGACIFRSVIITNSYKISSKVIVEDPQYKLPKIYKFKLFTKKEIYDTKFFSDLNLDEAKKKNLVEVRDFSLDEIKEALKKNKVVLLRVNMGPLLRVRTIPDYILLYGYGNNLYLWNNTLTGQTLRINEKLMKEIFLQVKTKCKRDNRAIIFG